MHGRSSYRLRRTPLTCHAVPWQSHIAPPPSCRPMYARQRALSRLLRARWLQSPEMDRCRMGRFGPALLPLAAAALSPRFRLAARPGACTLCRSSAMFGFSERCRRSVGSRNQQCGKPPALTLSGAACVGNGVHQPRSGRCSETTSKRCVNVCRAAQAHLDGSLRAGSASVLHGDGAGLHHHHESGDAPADRMSASQRM